MSLPFWLKSVVKVTNVNGDVGEYNGYFQKVCVKLISDGKIFFQIYVLKTCFF